MELALRRAGQMLVQTRGDEAFARPSRRRSTLADMRQDLEALEHKPGWRWRAKVALAFYTLAHIASSLLFASSYSTYHHIHEVCDAIFRPLVTGFGLYMFIHRMDRFSISNQLHLWSLITMCCLMPLGDDRVERIWGSILRRASLPPRGVPFLLWEVLCNVLQVYMSILKLRALGWHRTARWCGVLTTLGVSSLAVFLLTRPLQVFLLNQQPYSHDSMRPILLVTSYTCFGCCFAVMAIQCWALCRAASSAMGQARSHDPIWWTACLLYANACLVPLGPAWSVVSFISFFSETDFPRTLVTLDVSFQVFNVLLLSGMVGAAPMNLEALQRLAELSGFGLASARVAFPGHISQSAKDCVVSFPGKYSKLWDKAVSSATEEDTFSLACVFLTDTVSGLGQHADCPETSGKCWCSQIYGPVPASTYLSVVEISADESQDHDQELAFKRADAEAMGQRLLIKQHQGDIEWEQELTVALEDAEVRCVENQYRAPWGCQWFEEWKKNVDRAAELHQVLHIFYFENRKGEGKMPWELLANERARQEARKNSGLGASQTAEVAYLDKIGLSYVEHDIMEFEAFLSSRR